MYRRTIQIPQDDRRGRVLLHFGAVDNRADVWLNGRLVAQHEGGHTPISADITPVLGPADVDQVIVVRAEDQPLDLEHPRAKQDWEERPHKIWYHRATGIWQPVWLEPLSRCHMADVLWTPDLDRGFLGLHLRLNRIPDRPLALRLRLSLRGEKLESDTCAMKRIEHRRASAITLAERVVNRDEAFWSPRRSSLVDAERTLMDGEEVVDRVLSYAGVSSHRKFEDPRFLYWRDRLGLLVWGEMANAHLFSPTAVKRLSREWPEVHHRDYSHPYIVTWMPITGSWGVPALESDPAQQDLVRGLYLLTKALDPTRPVIGNDG